MSREKRVATYTDDGIICDNTIIVGVPYHSLKNVNNKSISKYFKNLNLNREIVEEASMNYDLKYLLGIINSKLISYFLKFNARSKTDSYPDDWKKIPIKKLKIEEQKVISDFVSDILKIRSDKDFLSNGTKQKQIRSLENKIDKLIYKLYGLSEDDIKIIEESVS